MKYTVKKVCVYVHQLYPTRTLNGGSNGLAYFYKRYHVQERKLINDDKHL